jgi:hypothetical protein
MPRDLTQAQRELFRQQALRMLADRDAGRKIDPAALLWAKAWAHPVRDEQLPPALRGGALERF